MRRAAGRALFLCLALAAAPAAAEVPAWTLEPGSSVGFLAKQGGAPVDGRFESFTGEIAFDPEDLANSRVAIDIEVASVNSQSSDRDQVIRSKDLFDVATWPKARFEADAFEALGGDSYAAHGRLTLRDVTREVTLPFTLMIGDHPERADSLRAHAVGEVTVKRLDYGVGQGDWRDISVVADEVTIAIDILARRPKQ